MCGQYLSRDVHWYHVTFTWLMLLPFVRPTDIGFCDIAMTTDVIVRILKAAHDNQRARCVCYISPSGTMTVQVSYRLAITKSDCGEEYYFYFNGTEQFWRCSNQGINTAANNSSVFGYESRGMWLYYIWKENIRTNITGHIEVKLQATAGNINVQCNQNDKRTKATTQRSQRPTTSFTPNTTRSQLTITESMTWGQTLGATTYDHNGTTSLVTSKSTVTEPKGGVDDETVGNKSDTFIIIAAVVAVAFVTIIIITIITVICYRRRRKSANYTGGESNGDLSQGIVYAEPNKLYIRKIPRTTQSIHRRGSDELEPVPVPEKSWEHENEGNIYYNETTISSHSKPYDTTDRIMVENEVYAHAT